MIYECVLLADKMAEAAANGDKKLEDELDDRLGFLTPILKGFLTEKGLEAANAGIQLWVILNNFPVLNSPHNLLV